MPPRKIRKTKRVVRKKVLKPLKKISLKPVIRPIKKKLMIV